MNSHPIKAFFKREPVAHLAIVQAVVALVVSFGLDLSTEQVGTITALAAVLLGVTARQRVQPE